MVMIRITRALQYTSLCTKFYSKLQQGVSGSSLSIGGKNYPTDDVTNVTARILEKVGRNLHTTQYHPLNLILQRIKNYFYSSFTNSRGDPTFAVFENINPVVTLEQNFDSLLVPPDHASRALTDTYYVNKDHLLRAHTSAHQRDLIAMGFDAFLVAGDVYRRDEIDATHYPVFHQCEGVKLYKPDELFADVAASSSLSLFEQGTRTPSKQELLTLKASKLLESHLKRTLIGLSRRLFGKDIEARWVKTYFPFTHPSFELEIKYGGEWMEVLGCGVMEQKLLNNAGANDRVGWAFGLGLERLAMKLYAVPDIRLFWNQDPGMTHQFRVDDSDTIITYKPVSVYPACMCNIAFWLPSANPYNDNDFYDLVRTAAGDVVERVQLVDEFRHPKTGRVSRCYRLAYRHMNKSLTQAEVNIIHKDVETKATQILGVEIR